MNIFITGVSSGIGFATAERFLSMGHDVIGTLRTPQDVERIEQELQGQNRSGNATRGKFHAITLDVKNSHSVIGLAKRIQSDVGMTSLDVLVNNAGVAFAAPFLEQDFSEIEAHFSVNVLGLMRVTQELLPLLGATDNPQRRAFAPGKIINISSVAGRVGTPFLAAYVASKHAVEGFSASLRRELMVFGIDVVVVGPGSVKTPIWKKGVASLQQKKWSISYQKAFAKFVGFAQAEENQGLEANEVADLVLSISTRPKNCTRYAIVPRPLRNWYLPKLIPERQIDKAMAKFLFSER